MFDEVKRALATSDDDTARAIVRTWDAALEITRSAVSYPAALSERPAEGNARATAAASELFALVGAGRADWPGNQRRPPTLLERLVHDLFRLVAETRDRYFAEVDVSVERVASILYEHLVADTRGLWQKKPRTMQLARFLKLIVMHGDLADADINRAGAVVKDALGTHAVRRHFFRSDSVKRLEAGFAKALVSMTSRQGTALEMADLFARLRMGLGSRGGAREEALRRAREGLSERRAARRDLCALRRRRCTTLQLQRSRDQAPCTVSEKMGQAGEA